MPDTERKNDLGVPAGAGAIDPDLPSPNVLARLDALAERRNQPDIVAFLRNRAEDSRNDAKIMRERGEDGGEFDYLERNFDRAANSHHAMKEALHEMTCEYRRELGNEFQKIAWDKARAALKLAEI